MLKILAAATLTLVTVAPAHAKLASAASMSASDRTFVRGKVVAYSAPMLTVKTREGPVVTVVLAADAQAATVNRITLEDIKPGSYIGTSAEPAKDGTLKAIEVHVFPEAMRGTGDGHYGWTLTKKSSMTNGNVSTVAEGGKAKAKAKGRLLTVDYKGGTQQVYVPPSVPIVAFAPATLSQLAPGVPVFVIAMPTPDGKLAASRITLGTNGVAPPM